MTAFGTLNDGRTVDAITLSAHGLCVTVLTFGAIVQDVRLDGVDHSLTIGSPDLADYEGMMHYHGCIVAPVANRISNATAQIAGTPYQFDANENGQHTLHSGTDGAHKHVWRVEDVKKDQLTLSHHMPAGHGGFPGNRQITARFEILSGATLRLTLTTTTDARSLVNATNHSYWNLDGSNHSGDHHIQIAAQKYLPVDANSLVTGEVCSVAGTAFDFRTPKLATSDQPPLDNTFCVADRRRALTDCAWITGSSGLKMTLSTTEAGVHLYDARDSGYRGIAVEAQGWPDAPNNPDFPSIDITPDAPVVQITQWRFTR